MWFFVCVLLLVSASDAAQCPEVFVAVNGSDSGQGSEAQPYKTIRRALYDVAKGLASRVNVMAGTYFLEAPLDMSGLGFGPAGTACPPTVAAFPDGATVLVSGAAPIPLAAFTPYTGGGGAGQGAVTANLAVLGIPVEQEQCSGSLNGDGHFYPGRAVPSGARMYDLLSDTALTQAAFPPIVPITAAYDSFIEYAPWVESPGGIGGPLAAVGFGANVSARLSTWAAQLSAPEPGIWAHGNWEAAWADATFSVVSWNIPPPGPDGVVNGSFSVNNTGACAILCDNFCNPQPGATFQLINLLAEVQQPRDYYVNYSSGAVVLIPPSADWSPVVVVLPTIFTASGAANLMISGLTLRHARAQLVSWTNCTNCTVSGSSLAFAGAQCMNVSGGSGSGVTGSTLHDCGIGAVFLDGGDRFTLTPAQHRVSNSTIFNFNSRVWTNAPGVILSGVGGQVTNSEIHTGPHQGLYAMGNQHIVADNYFHHLVLHSCDAGAFYIGRDWTYRGIQVVNNTFESMESDLGCNPWFSVTAVYADDGASGLTVAGNRFLNVARAIRAYGGRSHRIINNSAAGVRYDFLQMDNLPSSGSSSCSAPGSTQVERLLAMPFNTSAVWLAAYSAYPDNLPSILSQDPCNNHFDLVINNTGCGVGGQLLVPHNVSQIEAWGGVVSGNNVSGTPC